jgi:hypothetical protein
MDEQPERTAVIRRLQRPPVRQSTTVRSDRDHVFDTFVRTIGAWWPVKVFSAGKELVCDVTIEPRRGGRVYETWNDGGVVNWGQVVAWEPPARFMMTWIGTPRSTEVEFTFMALGPALTRVTVEHRGWEALTDEELEQDCALPGGYRSGAYTTGWERILAAFSAVAGERKLTAFTSTDTATETADVDEEKT